MKIQAYFSDHFSGIVTTARQRNTSIIQSHGIELATRIQTGIILPVNTGFSGKQKIIQCEYSAAERKVRAEAFIERSGKLKYYINLIQSKLVT